MNKGIHMGKEMINHKLSVHFCVFAVSISMLMLQVSDYSQAITEETPSQGSPFGNTIVTLSKSICEIRQN